jgi:hypothetical protein
MLQDLRYALRALARHRTVSIMAVASLGLGIGANAAIFSVVRTVLLRPLIFSDEERVVRVYIVPLGGETRLSPCR